jgi:hypothetical protein
VKPKNKAKPSPASMPIIPEVEVPPKPSSSNVPHKDDEVIHIDDKAKNVDDSGKIKEVSHGMPSMPSTEAPVKTTTEAPADDASKDK